MKDFKLEGSILALFVGFFIGNVFKLPSWFRVTMRPEYFLKIGIILLGASLPITMILSAGPIAIGQSVLISTISFTTVYLVGSKGLGLDKAFAACLAGGVAVGNVTGVIGVGEATKAKLRYISAGFALICGWSVALVFILTGLGEALALPMGVLGAWIGSGQVADVAGFAALQTLDNESALRSYTLVKVIGRDLSVAVWSFIMATIAVTRWSSVSHDEEVHHSVLARIWYRFPKFVIGLFLASIITALVIHLLPGEFLNDYHKSVLGTLKNYRSWFFTLCFLCIGLNTNIKDLKDVGWKAFFAFTVGILVLVLVGYILSAYIFLDFWQFI